MTWSCRACTFDNGADEAVVCAVCGTRRIESFFTKNQPIKARSRKAKRSNDSKGQSLAWIDDNNISKKSRSKKHIQIMIDGDLLKAEDGRRKKKARTEEIGKCIETVEAVNPKVTKQRKVPTAHFNTLKERADKMMKSNFGIQSLRKLQPIAVDLALKRKSQIIVMATGGGKSLCYQLPAAVLGGVTIVISPLISLMIDQVNKLNERGVSAALVSSASGERNNIEVMERLLGRHMDGKKSNKDVKKKFDPITLLYGTPELIQTDRFRKIMIELYRKDSLTLFAIDEAHCLSTWGHDFRPAYRKLNWLRTTFPSVPCMACTATATSKVIADIRETLLLNEEDAPCNMSSFNRSNISYEVRYKDSLDAMRLGGAISDLIEFIKTQHTQAEKESMPCNGIVYVHRRQDTGIISKQIGTIAGIKASPYHAGLKDIERRKVQEKWTNGEIKVVVATVAFGMGIDLAHVRYVIHWSMAKTMEGFYQESGRSGRDGKGAISVLYFSQEDFKRFEFIVRKSSQSRTKGGPIQHKKPLEALKQMRNYCVAPSCRRSFLLAHFGEKINPGEVCNMTCDYCKNPSKVQKAIEASYVIKDVLKSATNFSRSIEEEEEWDGQWQQPHGDKFDNKWIENNSNNTESLEYNSDSYPLNCDGKTSFTKARSILSKYEEMEESQGDGQPSRSKPIEIPKHLRNSLPDPLSRFQKKNTDDSKNESSSVLQDRLTHLRKSLEKLKAQRVANLEAHKAKAKMQAKIPLPLFIKGDKGSKHLSSKLN